MKTRREIEAGSMAYAGLPRRSALAKAGSRLHQRNN